MSQIIMLGLVFGAVAASVIFAWKASSTKTKFKQLDDINRMQRKVIDGLAKANGAQISLRPVFDKINDAEKVEDYEKIYNDILGLVPK